MVVSAFLLLITQAAAQSCVAGRYSTPCGCILCPLGQFQNLSGQTSCKSCSVGRYQDVEGSKACKTCTIQPLFNTTGSISCTSCPMGKYGAVFGTFRFCADCAAGRYTFHNGTDQASISGHDICPGTCTNSTVQARPHQCCAVGRVRSSGTCADCPAGKYGDSIGRRSCRTCPSGRSSTAGSSSCFPVCPDGQIPGNLPVPIRACVHCSAGRYKSSRTVCSQCPSGRVGLQSQATNCTVREGSWTPLSNTVGRKPVGCGHPRYVWGPLSWAQNRFTTFHSGLLSYANYSNLVLRFRTLGPRRDYVNDLHHNYWYVCGPNGPTSWEQNNLWGYGASQSIPYAFKNNGKFA